MCNLAERTVRTDSTSTACNIIERERKRDSYYIYQEHPGRGVKTPRLYLAAAALIAKWLFVLVVDQVGNLACFLEREVAQSGQCFFEEFDEARVHGMAATSSPS
jgi:hypothetical protein